MKKLMILAAAALTLAACGNKTNNSESENTDALSSDTISTADEQLAAQTDGVEAAPADLWTEEAVKQHVRQMYDRLNETAAYVDFNQLDEEFCTGYYLGLKRNIARHDENAQGDMRFMGDEGGYRWMVGVGAPLEIVMLEADLLAGNEARARVKFKIDPKFADEQEGHNFMILELWMENGRWRVNNFDAPEAFGKGGYLNMMETYARENDIPLEDDEEPTEGAPV
ncbi:MAG: hypothetical protein IJ588_04200 [Prevotella sp.]|nr:hypothetical protein [Prevotella sp.]